MFCPSVKIINDWQNKKGIHRRLHRFYRFFLCFLVYSAFFYVPLHAMNEANCTQLLEEHGIKPTANRIVVLKELVKALRPVSLSELEYKILSIDKSNIFRALTLFKEHRLVHVIEGGSEGVRYELCHSHNHDHDEDLHPHFYCEKCQRTTCLDYAEIPEVRLPKGYEKKSANLMIKGICPDCQSKL